MSDKRLTLELVTPEKVAWSAPADFVVLPAFNGEMGVLPGHQPFLVQLGAGEVRVTDKDQVKSFAVSGGFAEVNEDRIALFAETAEEAGQIDAEKARQALEKAKAESTKAGLDPMQLAAAEASIRRELARLRVATRAKSAGSPPPHHPEN